MAWLPISAAARCLAGASPRRLALLAFSDSERRVRAVDPVGSQASAKALATSQVGHSSPRAAAARVSLQKLAVGASFRYPGFPCLCPDLAQLAG